MLGITRTDIKRITWIRSQSNVFDITERIKGLKWKWAELVSLQEDKIIDRLQILYRGIPEMKKIKTASSGKMEW